jgi:nucleoside-diphosphate-sugar epimerase
MRVLVTGASSLLGASIARALAARGDDVVCLQRRRADGVDLEQVLGDVRDQDAVRRAMAGRDAVVHAAAKVGVVGTEEEYRSVNLDGTRTVLAAARHAGVERFVHVSSPSVAHGGEPLVGATATPARTGRRRAHYAETKALAEQHVLAAADAPAVVVVRPHLVWGPGDTQLVGRIVERARAGRLALVAGGRALVDTTYLDDAVSAHVAALDAVVPGSACAGHAYVVAGGSPRPIRDLVAGICAAAGARFEPRDVPGPMARAAGSVVERIWPRLRDDEPPLTRFLAEQLGTAHWFDLRATRQDLGWEPTVGVDEGLRRLAAWFARR